MVFPRTNNFRYFQLPVGWVVVIMAFLMFVPLVVWGQQQDTLRLHHVIRGYFTYSTRGIQSQIARFELSRASFVVSARIIVAGNSKDGGITVRLFGDEGGAPVPRVGRALAAPQRILKTKAGFDTLVVDFSKESPWALHQVFVSIEEPDAGVLVLTDNTVAPLGCRTGTLQSSRHILQMTNGTWQWGPFSLAVELVTKDDTAEHTPQFVDVSEHLGLSGAPAFGAGIAWADIDHDGYQDCLTSGRLYHNNSGTSFTDITDQAGLMGIPRHCLFLDYNRDGRIDILFLGHRDSATTSGTLFQNLGDGRFQEFKSFLPVIEDVVSTSVGESTSDGTLLYVSQRTATSGMNHLLLQISRDGVVQNLLESLQGFDVLTAPAGSQWMDFDNDGDLDLVVTDRYRGPFVIKNLGSGKFSPALALSQNVGKGSTFVGCMTIPGNRKGVQQIAVASSVRGVTASTVETATTLSYHPMVENAQSTGWAAVTTDYIFAPGPASIADINNDGRPDLFVAPSSLCGWDHIFLADSVGGMFDASVQLGLSEQVSGPDVVWVDYDNDGRLDLTSAGFGGVRILRNTIEKTGNFVAFDLVGPAPGTRVLLYSNGGCDTGECGSGHGFRVQSAQRLHFGLGEASGIDSAVVVWSDGERQSVRNLDMNHYYTLTRTSQLATVQTPAFRNIRAVPNPFKESVVIEGTVGDRGTVTIEIIDSKGTLVRRLEPVDLVAGPFVVSWDGYTQQGDKCATGVYICRLQLDGKVGGSVTISLIR